jgi:hypothetical protein
MKYPGSQSPIRTAWMIVAAGYQAALDVDDVPASERGVMLRQLRTCQSWPARAR